MRFFRSLASAVSLLILALAAGFLVFVATLPGPGENPAPADGIVALTGGEQRIEAALALLADGKARRLLISGLHPDTLREDVAARAGARPFMDCCIDLDWIAQNTEGNAGAAARWARDHSFSRIIVVTANYHMPRAILELETAMPETDWVPYAVVPESIAAEDWWQDADAMRLLGSEYMKLIAAGGRVGMRWLADSLNN
ncbi:MAG TPA: YdcF family protein [Micropepsaceae bacterium]|nr:YdcF family protein [Micropepsaceae bacterium]